MKKILPVLTFSILLLVPVGAQNAFADTFTHFGNGPFADVTTLLNNLGIPTVPGSETIAEEFMVPGVIGTVDLTFTFERDTGAFEFSFGFCDSTNVIGIDPIAQKQQWATACLASATEVFDDSLVNVPATSMHTVNAGSELIFYIIPDNDLTTFNANPSSFFPSQTGTSSLRSPLFSVSNANPSEFDQMLSFIGGGVTLFTFEDLTRSGPTDNDFTDIAFSIDVELMPMMEKIIGGEIIQIESTSLILAGAQSFSWMIPILLSGIGIGLFAVSRRSD